MQNGLSVIVGAWKDIAWPVYRVHSKEGTYVILKKLNDNKGIIRKEKLSNITPNTLRVALRELKQIGLTYEDDSGAVHVSEDGVKQVIARNRQRLMGGIENLDKNECEKRLEVEIEPFVAHYVVDLGGSKTPEVVKYAAREHPFSLLKTLEGKHEEKDEPFTIELRNVPADIEISPFNPNPRSVGKLVRVKGYIMAMREIQAKLVKAAWICRRCGEPNELVDLDPFHPEREPIICANPNCGKKGPFDLDNGHSRVSQTRIVKLCGVENSHEGLLVQLVGENAGSVLPGEFISVVGILQTIRKGKEGRFFAVRCLQIERPEPEDREFQVDEFKKLVAESKDVALKVAKDIFGRTAGMELVKKALVVSAARNKWTFNAEGYKRSNINIMLMTDPGMNKRAIGNLLSHTVPLQTVDATQASTRGIIASYVKDEKMGNVVVPGKLPMADRGYCLIEEYSGLSKYHQTHLRRAMADGVVNYDKAGFHLLFNTRATVFAFTNFPTGFFSDDVKYDKLKNFDPVALSRFDLVLMYKSAVKDIEEIRKADELKPPDDKTLKFYEAFFDYVRTLDPKISKDLKLKISKLAAEIATKKTNKGCQIAYSRLYEAMQNITKAHAAVNLRQKADESDLKLAGELISESFEVRDRLRLDEPVITKLTEIWGDKHISPKQAKKDAEKLNIDWDVAEQYYNTMVERGEIISPPEVEELDGE